MADTSSNFSQGPRSASNGSGCLPRMTSAAPASHSSHKGVGHFEILADMFPHFEIPIIRNALLRGSFEDAVNLLLAADSDAKLKVDLSTDSPILPRKPNHLSQPPLPRPPAPPPPETKSKPQTNCLSFDLTHDDGEGSEKLPIEIRVQECVPGIVRTQTSPDSREARGKGNRIGSFMLSPPVKTTLRFGGMEEGDSPDSVLLASRFCPDSEEDKAEAKGGSGEEGPDDDGVVVYATSQNCTVAEPPSFINKDVIHLDSDSESEGHPHPHPPSLPPTTWEARKESGLTQRVTSHLTTQGVQNAAQENSERVEKLVAREAKKMSTGETAVFHNCTCYDKSLPSAFRAQLLTQLSAEGYSEDATTLPLPNSLVWRLRMASNAGEEKGDGSTSTVTRHLNHVVVLYEAKEFVEVVERGGVDEEIRKIKAAFPGHVITLLLPAVFGFVRKLSPASLLSITRNGGVGNKTDPQWDQISGSTWGKMLVSIPGVSTAHALAIKKEYPTMRSIMKVYRGPNSDADKEKLLQGLEIVRFGDDGIGQRDRVGVTTSKKVFRVLTSRGNDVTMAELLAKR